jgi:hypothetical protein
LNRLLGLVPACVVGKREDGDHADDASMTSIDLQSTGATPLRPSGHAKETSQHLGLARLACSAQRRAGGDLLRYVAGELKSNVFPAPVNLPIRHRLWSRATIDAALADAEKEAQRAKVSAITDSIAQEIRARAAERALDRSRTPAERKARREQARQAHAERAAARARKGAL